MNEQLVRALNGEQSHFAYMNALLGASIGMALGIAMTTLGMALCYFLDLNLFLSPLFFGVYAGFVGIKAYDKLKKWEAPQNIKE